jgi:hypothetical protein
LAILVTERNFFDGRRAGPSIDDFRSWNPDTLDFSFDDFVGACDQGIVIIGKD